MTLVEVMVALAVGSLLLTAGSVALVQLCRQWMLQMETDMETWRIARSVDSLRRAMSEAVTDPLSMEPWLSLETHPKEGLHQVMAISIRAVDEDGNRVQWEWAAPGHLEILSSIPGQSFRFGEWPVQFCLRFPEAKSAHYREGIAIGRNW